MHRLITAAVIIAFAFSAFTSLWLLSSCNGEHIIQLEPFATFRHACPGQPAGVSHVQLWEEIFLTFTLSIALLAVTLFRRLFTVSDSRTSRRDRRSLRQPPIRYGETPSMKPWDSILEALAAGTVQHGSRNQ